MKSKLLGSPLMSARPQTPAARAQPSALHVDGGVDLQSGAFHFIFRNAGYATATFQVCAEGGAEGQRTYIVEPDEELVDEWVVASPSGNYDFSVHGPHEFRRRFKGNVADPHEAALEIRLRYDDDGSGMTLDLSNHAAVSSRFAILNAGTGKMTQALIAPGGMVSKRWTIDGRWGWYDIRVAVDSHSGFVYHAAGCVGDSAGFRIQNAEFDIPSSKTLTSELCNRRSALRGVSAHSRGE